MSINTPSSGARQSQFVGNLDADIISDAEATTSEAAETTALPTKKNKKPRRPPQHVPYPLYLPPELKAIDQWVSWKMVYLPDRAKGGDTRWTKMPLCARQSDRYGKGAKSNDSSTWSTFDEAWAFHKKHKTAGIGFMLGGGITCIDLDKCRDRQTGVIAPWARDVINQCGSYWEISPSGKGVHIFGYGAVDADGPKRRGHVEMYSTVRFVTITGWMDRRDRNKDKPVPAMVDMQAAIDAIQAELAEFGDTACGQAADGERVPVAQAKFELLDSVTPTEDINLVSTNLGFRNSSRRQASPSSHEAAPPSPSRSHFIPVGTFIPSEADIIERAARASNGATFTELWNGGGLADHSAADLALCNLLAFYCGPNPDLIDSLFRQSGLYRDKWDTRRGGTTYGRQTIAKALAGRTVFYEWEAAARRQAERNQQAAEREAKRLADARRDYEVRVEAKQQRERRTSTREASNNAVFSCVTALYALMESRGLTTHYDNLPRHSGCGFSRILRGRADHSNLINGRLCCRRWSGCEHCRAKNTIQRAEHYATIFDKHDRANLPLTLWCGDAKQLESVKKRIKRADGEYVSILQPGNRFVVITNVDAACLDGVKCSEMRTLPRGEAIVAFIDAVAEVPEILDKRSRPVRASKFWQYGVDREPSKYEVDPLSDQISVQRSWEQTNEIVSRHGFKVAIKSEVSDGFEKAAFFCISAHVWGNLWEHIDIFGDDSICPPEILWRKPGDPCPFSSYFKRARGGKSNDENGHQTAAAGGDGATESVPRRSNWVDPSPN